jgi:hypothetical protein
MSEHFKHIVAAQFDAALAMLKQCIEACPENQWDTKIANGTFRWVVYHTLFFVDFYLTSSEHDFRKRGFHEIGGDEREPVACVGLSKADSLEYMAICRQKMGDTIAAESEEKIEGPSGFSWLNFSRGELHLYNVRHVQHHTGQLSAWLRRNAATCEDSKALPWVRSGWR